MYYSESNNCFFRNDGYQFEPAKKEHYKKFGFFLSEQDGKIYYVDNDSDQAISRLLRIHREHSVQFGFSTNPRPYSDIDLRNTWKYVQESGVKLRHFKTSKCVKTSEIC